MSGCRGEGGEVTGLLFPKGRPAKLAKADRLRTRVSIDEKESKKVKERSGGRCELIEDHPNAWSKRSSTAKRCERRAVHLHHCLSGIGVRGRGDSALAENKLHLCDRCHSDLHAHVLVFDGMISKLRAFRRVK